MADVTDLKSVALRSVRVQVPLSVPFLYFNEVSFFLKWFESTGVGGVKSDNANAVKNQSLVWTD